MHANACPTSHDQRSHCWVPLASMQDWCARRALHAPEAGVLLSHRTTCLIPKRRTCKQKGVQQAPGHVQNQVPQAELKIRS
jgi:hypothetical protein